MKPDQPLRTLAGFSPSAPAIDRDEVMFRAGRASARVGRGWKAAVALMVVAQVVGWTVWLTEPASAPKESAAPTTIAPVPPVEVAPADPTDPASYRALVVQWSGENPPAIPVSASPNSARPPLSVSAGHRGETFD